MTRSIRSSNIRRRRARAREAERLRPVLPEGRYQIAYGGGRDTTYVSPALLKKRLPHLVIDEVHRSPQTANYGDIAGTFADRNETFADRSGTFAKDPGAVWRPDPVDSLKDLAHWHSLPEDDFIKVLFRRMHPVEAAELDRSAAEAAKD